MQYTAQTLMQKIFESDKQYDIGKIITAYEFAEEAHKEQFRQSGEPYIVHPLAVAYILLELGMDSDTICAALLHDVVEDTVFTLSDVRKKLGEEVSMLVDGLTKLAKIPLFSQEEQQAENVRKILLAMSNDIRVIIIKLADRLHNMRTLGFKAPERRMSIARETMDIFAPLAHRLGIRALKEELEDLSFYYLDPYAYEEIENALQMRKSDREDLILRIKEKIAKRLDFLQMTPIIEGRVKSHYGIYKKVFIAGRSFDEVYDIYAVRVIVSTVAECYNVLGVIHDIFRPIPNRFKDYISTPKANMYQSLHTTVIDREGIPFEVQIRTTDMHYTAEYGIAAHWKYKAGIQGKDKFEDRLSWVRQLIEAQKDSNDATEIVYSIKNDIAPEEVFAFTPKGDVFALPLGSTIVDFAYAIHSQVGHRMMGAKVDGRMVPIDHVLQTGEIVEIITTKAQGHGPSRSWLEIAKTTEAKSKIRSWFKKEKREENVAEGKAAIESELKKKGIHLSESARENILLEVTKRKKFKSIDDLYAAIGYGGISTANLITRLREEYAKQTQSDEEALEQTRANTKEEPKGVKGGIIVEGLDNCLVKLSQCCNPLPGDDIIGFITRGHGVSIHKRDCINVVTGIDNPANEGRWVNTMWRANDQQTYRATLDILAYNRDRLIIDITTYLSNAHVPIHEINAKELKDGNANIVVTIGISSIEQLENVISHISHTKGVITVIRTGKA